MSGGRTGDVTLPLAADQSGVLVGLFPSEDRVVPSGRLLVTSTNKRAVCTLVLPTPPLPQSEGTQKERRPSFDRQMGCTCRHYGLESGQISQNGSIFKSGHLARNVKNRNSQITAHLVAADRLWAK